MSWVQGQSQKPTQNLKKICKTAESSLQALMSLTPGPQFQSTGAPGHNLLTFTQWDVPSYHQFFWPKKIFMKDYTAV